MAAKKGVSFRLSERCMDRVKEMAAAEPHLSEAAIIEIAVDRLYDDGGVRIVVGEDGKPKKGK